MTRHALPRLALLSLALPLSAQADPRAGEPASRATTETGLPSLARLTELVQKAHSGGEKHRPVEAFRAEVVVTKLDEGHRVQVNLGVRFRQKDLLRYEIKEGETKKERGIDEDGEWSAVGREVFNLNESRSETEKVVQQHLAICQQLVRFVDAAELLTSLQQKSDPRAATIDLAQDELAARCLCVTGYSKGFPLFQLPGKTKPENVRVELYFDAQKHRLRALGAQPLDAAARPIGPGEWITLNEFEDSKGYLLPKSIVVWEPGKDPKQLAQIEVRRILWNPQLVAADFARPKR